MCKGEEKYLIVYDIIYFIFYIFKIDLQISMNAWKIIEFAKEGTALIQKAPMIVLVQMDSS